MVEGCSVILHTVPSENGHAIISLCLGGEHPEHALEPWDGEGLALQLRQDVATAIGKRPIDTRYRHCAVLTGTRLNSQAVLELNEFEHFCREGMAKSSVPVCPSSPLTLAYALVQVQTIGNGIPYAFPML